MFNFILASHLWFNSYRHRIINRPRPTPVVTVSPVTAQNSDFTSQINTYRAKYGLSPIKTDSYSCAFAQKRSQEIVSNFSHSGWNLSSILSAYPTYSRAFENIAYGYNDSNIIQAWIDSPGHAENMRSNVTYVCVGKTGTYYAMEGYRP